MLNTAHITDYDRQLFLDKLLKSDLILDEWEMRFTGSYRSSSRPGLWFTPARRQAVDRMRNKYGSLADINMPLPLAPVTAAPVAEADPAGCMYLVTGEDKRQTRCNAPAVLMRRNGFRYCQNCADVAQALMKRTGGKMELSQFKISDSRYTPLPAGGSSIANRQS